MLAFAPTFKFDDAAEPEPSNVGFELGGATAVGDGVRDGGVAEVVANRAAMGGS